MKSPSALKTGLTKNDRKHSQLLQWTSRAPIVLHSVIPLGLQSHLMSADELHNSMTIICIKRMYIYVSIVTVQKVMTPLSELLAIIQQIAPWGFTNAYIKYLRWKQKELILKASLFSSCAWTSAGIRLISLKMSLF